MVRVTRALTACRSEAPSTCSAEVSTLGRAPVAARRHELATWRRAHRAHQIRHGGHVIDGAQRTGVLTVRGTPDACWRHKVAMPIPANPKPAAPPATPCADQRRYSVEGLTGYDALVQLLLQRGPRIAVDEHGNERGDASAGIVGGGSVHLALDLIAAVPR